MNVLEKIEGFSSFKNDIETIISTSEDIEGVERNIRTKKEKKDHASKTEKKKREDNKNKLMKFVTRIPLFMYLSDHRESTLKEVITKSEPELFKGYRFRQKRF